MIFLKIIDVDCGLGMAFKSYRYRDEEGLISYLDNCGIRTSVVYSAYALTDPELGNAEMLKIASESDGRILPCFVVQNSLPSMGFPGEGTPAQRLAASRPAAIRIFPTAFRFPFSAFYCEEILETAKISGVPVIIEPPYDNTFFMELPKVCNDYPEIPFILLRQGLNCSRTIFPIMRKLKNVYFDISIMDDVGQIEELVDRYGSDNLLFGGGLPINEPTGGLGLLFYSDITQEHRENIAYRNFERILGGVNYDV